MLLFSLGPVQSFIAQARKTRDLWLGSFLLSALMQAGMQDIKDQLIFPYDPHIKGIIPDLPNKYIALFETAEAAREAASKSEERITAFWKSVCQDVWNQVLAKPTRFSPSTRDQWEAQIEPGKVFEFFWVVVEGDEKQYADWLRRTQFLFNRRKNLRDFSQQEEKGEKGTVSGQRAALRGQGEWRSDVQMFWYQIAKEQSPKDISQDGTERLDAIDTVKRFAHLSDSLAQLLGHQTSKSLKAGFPSTSSMATSSFVEQLIQVSSDATIDAALIPWFNETEKLGETMPAMIPFLLAQARHQPGARKILERDGDCFFPGTFSEQRLKKEFGFNEQLKESREQLARNGPEAIKKLLHATDALTLPVARPTPYYAMIQMDGDKMGKLINGVQSRSEHRAISKALSTFSREVVPTIVEGRYPGRLIYAGGDDVFALAPFARDPLRTQPESESSTIKTVLNLVDLLQKKYRETVQAAVIDAPARQAAVTASAGIAIAHHYTSLSYVRRISKEAEQLAKNHYGRNALVITVLRRSGEQTRVGCHWHYDSLAADAQPIPLFLSFYDFFITDTLSPKCVHNLLEEAPTLVALGEDAQISEIKRILRRQSNTDDQNILEKTLPEKAEYLVRLAKAMDAEEYPKLDQTNPTGLAVELHAEGRRYGLVEVCGWLLTMLFLARKVQA